MPSSLDPPPCLHKHFSFRVVLQAFQDQPCLIFFLYTWISSTSSHPATTTVYWSLSHNQSLDRCRSQHEADKKNTGPSNSLRLFSSYSAQQCPGSSFLEFLQRRHLVTFDYPVAITDSVQTPSKLAHPNIQLYAGHPCRYSKVRQTDCDPWGASRDPFLTP